MTAVLVHPTGVGPGKAHATDHWQLTIESQVEFDSGAVAAALSEADRTELDAWHPAGHARFWGTHDKNGWAVERLVAGDVVILTGQRRVKAFGRVGHVTRNAALGRALWPHPAPGGRVYSHVYSLAAFSPVDIPLADLREQAQIGPQFGQWLRFLDGAEASRFLDLFGHSIPAPTRVTSPVEAELRTLQDYDDADATLAADLSWVRELPIEVRALGDSPVRARRESLLHRGENLLVHRYLAGLPSAAIWCRYATEVGVTDLDVHMDGRHELVEAKSSAARTYIRQALAQLLDYAPSLGDLQPDVLTVLVPSRPPESAIALLHRYGVDCLFLDDGVPVRVRAPEARAAAMAALWAAPDAAGGSS